MSDDPRQLTAVGAYVYAGGFSVGVRRAGFDVLCHLEGDNGYGVSSAKLNWPELPIFFGPGSWPTSYLREQDIDFVFSNPPCAIFSPMGIVTTRGEGSWRSDPRLDHWRDCFSLLDTISPRAWCTESVHQAYRRGRDLIDEMTKLALLRGYSVTHLLLDAMYLGLPQSRKRLFIVAHRPPVLVGYQPNWQPPPTVGSFLAEVDEPGFHSPLNPKFLDALRECRPGEGLSTAWERINPGFNENRNAQGKVAGRPSFQDQRLDPNATMGAFVGNKYYHPTENRMIGVQEMKALCGYPPDFKLAPPESGWGSMLARAVMPPVGAWLARALADTLSQADAAWSDRRVTKIDLRKPDLPVEDLTGQYLDLAGRVRLRLRTDGTAGFLSYKADSAPERDRIADAAAFATIATKPAPEITQAAVASEEKAAPVRETTGAEELAALESASGEEARSKYPTPLAGEGSGRYLQRMWKTTDLAPDQLVEAVHEHYPNRTTKRSDVYYNYKKLVDAGEAVRPWSLGSVKVARPAASLTVKPSQPAQPRHAPRTPVVDDGRPRFLVTGTTPIQVGSERTALQIVTSTRAVVAALDALGFNVDWRAVTPGEDLEAYAGCLVYLQKSNSIASRYFYGALWTMLKRPDAIIGMDDWQTHTVHAGFKTFARSYERAFRLFDRTGEAEFEAHKDELFAGVKRYADELPWPHPVIVPVFEGGDVSRLRIPSNDVVPIDPTAFAPRYPYEATERERAWVQASLLVKPPPADVEWPVSFFGNAGTGYGGVGRSTVREPQERIPEPELMRVYCRHWGVLSPAHDHSGSGWWRVRYLMAADAGCVLSASRDEARVLGEAYEVAADVRYVESLNDLALENLALAQKEALAAKALPQRSVLDRLSEVISAQGVRLPVIERREMEAAE